jgi:hypothetical protein
MNDIIFSYTRAQAIEDGVLVDVSQLAKEAGFRYPVAVTQGVWADCISVAADDVAQDETGRLWDILNVLRYRIRRAKDEQVLFFEVLIAKGNRRPKPVRLKSHCEPGDNAEPVITIMLPNED